MLAELRTKSQITLPKEIVSHLGLSEGDTFDIFERDGMICMMPVAVYPKESVQKLRSEIEQVKERLKKGEQPVFDSIDALFAALDKN